ncbi:MAG TPA: thiamine-phosphate kinase [Rhodospirillales bacterium]
MPVVKAKRPDEFELIRRFFAPLAAKAPGALGLTDDAALIKPPKGHELVVTTDALVEGVHFPFGETPESVAARALGVNLSDLAAMGARPLAYTMAIALGDRCGGAWIGRFAGELGRLQKTHRIDLIGGDTVATTGPLTVSITAFGVVRQGMALRRNAARPGDGIYVSGTIGDAALGLRALEGRLRGLAGKHRKALLDRFQRPRPRVCLGRALVGVARAAIDVSDGLVADVGHVARASRLTAEIDAGRVPLSAAARAAIAGDPKRLSVAITGGDDYELAFTAPPRADAAIARIARSLKLRITRIGRMKKGDGGTVMVTDGDGRPIRLARGGYRHF